MVDDVAEIEVCDLCSGTGKCPNCNGDEWEDCDLCLEEFGTCPQCGGRGYHKEVVLDRLVERVMDTTQRMPPVCDGPHDPVKLGSGEYFCALCGTLCDASGKAYLKKRGIQVMDSAADNDNPDFICLDCGSHVYSIGPDPEPDLHVCYSCRFIREHPDLPEDIKRTLRGD